VNAKMLDPPGRFITKTKVQGQKLFIVVAERQALKAIGRQNAKEQ
jgi:hypothetical protein